MPSSKSSATDGGYGWVVCISGFFCWFIGDGVAFSYGVLYVSLLEQFSEGPSTTSWVGAAFIGGHNLMGPVAGVSVKKLGCRATVFVGSIIAASGFVLGTFSPNIAVLALTYGAMGGSGLNLLLVASVDMVAKYFNKRRALANGIVTCGAGAGGFIIPLLLKFLIDKYNWDGSLLILAGISLNGCVLGALFRPLETLGKVVAAVSEPESSEEHVSYVAAGSETKFCAPTVFNATRLGRNGAESQKLAISEDSGSLQAIPNNFDKSINPNQGCYVPSIEISPGASSESIPDPRDESIPVDPDETCPYEIIWTEKEDIMAGGTGTFLRKQHGCRLGGSDSSIDENEVHGLHPGYGQSPKAEYASAVFIGSMASISGVEMTEKTPAKRRRSLAVVTSRLKSCPELFGLDLISSNPMFILVIISCTFWTAQTTMFIYLVDYALSCDIDKTHGTVLLSIIGILNTIGRILIGLLTDHPRVDCYLVYGLSLVIAGIVNLVVPFCTGFAVLALCSAVFGLCVACFVSLRAIIIVDFLGVDQMIRGFGLVLFCQGIGFLIGPPIAAAIYEASGTYVATFLTAGVFLIFGAIAIIPVRLLKRKSSSVT